jgi:UDP-glucose 4-epimerase
MNVLVTGGAGFIGANLCRALRAAPDVERVAVLDDLSTGSKLNLVGIEGVDLMIGSILEEESLAAAFDGIDTVVHLAARPSVPRSLEDPVASHAANASGTVAVLEEARRRAGVHVIIASSSSVYGSNPALPKREDLEPQPMSPYAASKLAAEAYTLAYGRSFGLSVLAFRFFNVFGPLQPADHAYAAVVPAFVSAALRGEPLTIYGDGEQTRDFTFVGTVASVLTDAAQRRVTNPRAVNLAFGSRISLLALIAELESLLGQSLERIHKDPRTGDVRDSQADQSQLRSLFPDVTPIPLREGLDATISWFKNRRD